MAESVIILTVFVVLFVIWYIWTALQDAIMATDPTVVRLKNKLVPVFPELDRINIIKTFDGSYTINKHKIYLCTEHNGKMYDDNMLIYVVLHELAHVKSRGIGHGAEFMKEFGTLLKKAEQHRLWDPKKPRDANYCGTISA